MDRVGMKSVNNFGSIIQVVRYKNASDVDIYFPQYDWTYYNARYDYFSSGCIKCPYEPRVFCVGFIGEGKYNFKEYKHIYKVWGSMLERCYSKDYQLKRPTYINCLVCDEWHNFQNFAQWFENNYYEVNEEEMHLDKDILFKGNKIYSPETCVFVPNNINMLFTKSNKSRGNYPIGVTIDNKINKFRARCSIFDKEIRKYKRISLGYYSSVIEAFNCYKDFKEQHIKNVADDYKDYIPLKLYNAMYNYNVDIDD